METLNYLKQEKESHRITQDRWQGKVWYVEMKKTP